MKATTATTETQLNAANEPVETGTWIDTLQPIIKEWQDDESDPLDGDAVERLCEIIKAKINLQQGNICEQVYERVMNNVKDEIAIVWHIEDVITRAKDTDVPVPTEDEAREILRLIDADHDCNSGVNWGTIDYYLTEYTTVDVTMNAKEQDFFIEEEPTEEVKKLSAAFNKVLNEWCLPKEMEEINRRNATPEYDGSSCASHDFYDANMAMAEAFVTVFEREIDLQSDTDIELWNAAWELSKSQKFAI